MLRHQFNSPDGLFPQNWPEPDDNPDEANRESHLIAALTRFPGSAYFLEGDGPWLCLLCKLRFSRHDCMSNCAGNGTQIIPSL
eukprot:4733972-Amphidinium_carterae.1